jgi:3-methylcrotonyl-CoA carboxylase alpha subunit
VLAPDRAQCLARLRLALDQYLVLGVTTNLPLLRAVLETPDFQVGALTADFLDRHGQQLLAAAEVTPTPERAVLAAAGWRLTLAEQSTAPDPWRAGPWQLAGQGMVLRFGDGTPGIVVTASRADQGEWSIELPTGHRLVAFERREPATLVVREGDRAWEARLAETAGTLQIALDGQVHQLALDHGPAERDRKGTSAAGSEANALRTPLPGTVVKLNVAVGDEVEAGQPLVVVEAMKMEHTIVAPHAGAVTRLHYGVGERVAAGALLAEVRG